MYLVKNEHTGVTEPIGSMTAISDYTGIAYSKLSEQFSRQKKTSFVHANWVIEKKQVIKSKRT